MLKMVSKMIQPCRDYSNAHAIYVGSVLDWILKVAYRQGRSMLVEQWLGDLEMNAKTSARIAAEMTASEKRNYLLLTDFTRPSSRQAMQLLSTVTY